MEQVASVHHEYGRQTLATAGLLFFQFATFRTPAAVQMLFFLGEMLRRRRPCFTDAVYDK